LVVRAVRRVFEDDEASCPKEVVWQKDCVDQLKVGVGVSRNTSIGTDSSRGRWCHAATTLHARHRIPGTQ
jgi:hypothetical protein